MRRRMAPAWVDRSTRASGAIVFSAHGRGPSIAGCSRQPGWRHTRSAGGTHV